MPQQSFGDRKPFTVRVPDEHATVYKAEASRCGMTWSDYLAAKLAEAHDLPTPESVRARYDDGQEVLTESAS